jgi:hypothetical protein
MEGPATYVVTVDATSAEDALRKIEVDIVPELRRQVAGKPMPNGATTKFLEPVLEPRRTLEERRAAVEMSGMSDEDLDELRREFS